MALQRKLCGSFAESFPPLIPLGIHQNPQHFHVAIAARALRTSHMYASLVTKEQKMKLFPAKGATSGRWQSLSFVMIVKQSLAKLLRSLIQIQVVT